MKPPRLSLIASFLCAGLVLPIGLAAAESAPPPGHEVVIQYANRRFAPTTVEVRAGEPLEIRVVNRSAERIEFESFKLHREKVVAPGETLVLRLPALKPGTYDFFDDFHDAVPEGAIVARAVHN